MTDDPAPDGPDAPEIADVRRLLAEARHDEPMPADVAARLDDVLAGLAERPRGDGGASVVPIGSRRRRRAVAGWLTAAAAVVAAFVIAPHISLHGASPSGGTAGSTMDNAPASPRPQSQKATPGATGATDGRTGLRLLDGRVLVRPHHFADDAREARDRLAYADQLASPRSTACADPGAAAHVVPAEYRHARAALVYHRAEGGRQVVDLYLCGQGEPVRSTTLRGH
ncbi:MAG TPA: hypothetical protein VHW64_06510 [Nocardioides sp.]|jgi:hypothetical protein|uniref:hypothetical protein n=1 Tax=Nocardioides sp. TaxID=35761 RepID=UPI002E30A187|nr:hypothetical protein [Nocardioides sp.]HEX3930338.1 hypothetical protein [Nocardioides sp.]